VKIKGLLAVLVLNVSNYSYLALTLYKGRAANDAFEPLNDVTSQQPNPNPMLKKSRVYIIKNYCLFKNSHTYSKNINQLSHL
jgi:hypothetical protein